jgi:chemotaxis protein MotB
MRRTALLKTAASTVLLVALSLPAWGAEEVDFRPVLYGDGATRFSAGFIRESLPLDATVNQITGDNAITGNRRLVGSTDVIYLNLITKEIRPGDILTVYRQRHKVFHPATGRYLGYLYDVRGIVKVVKIEENLAAVHIVKSYDSVSPGDGVMRFVLPEEDLEHLEEPLATPTNGMIVDVEPARTLLGQRDVVYVDWGRDHGLRVGSRLEVFRTGGGLPVRTIGEMRVLSIEDHTASALIINSLAPFLKGDRFTVKQIQPETAQTDVSGSTAAAGRPTTVAKATPPIELQREGMRLTINLDDLVDQLEYESGEFRVTPEGMDILRQVTEVLKGMPDKQVTVEGHTDNVPIGPSLRAQFPDNMALSKARANTVARHLVQDGGLDPAHISAVGVADTKPVASNTKEEGRKKNRRIEIVVTPLESETDAPIRLPAEENGSAGQSLKP